jgi:hypothetical protein
MDEWRKHSARADGMYEMHINSHQFFAMAVVRDVSLQHVCYTECLTSHNMQI